MYDSRHWPTKSWLLGMFAALALVAGCSVGLESSVKGIVTLDGNAIGPGTVVFVSADGDRNPARGAVQPNGSYSLKTANTMGLRPGKYKVSVTILDQPQVAPGERSFVEAKLRIPEKYTRIESSGLEFDVTSGSNAIDIPLVSK